jgi:hypothetical protein
MPESNVSRVIKDWVHFHMFKDDCEYPLISPSYVVLEDLEFRLSLLAETQDFWEIDKKSRERWETIPYNKGKQRYLRRL